MIFITLVYSHQQESGRLAVSDVSEFRDSALVVRISLESITIILQLDKKEILKHIVK